MNPIIKIVSTKLNDEVIQTVNARELHQFLEIKTRFNDWATTRINEYRFEENRDFATFTENSVKGRPRTEYALSLDMAKELSMVERNEKGKQARQYFIECERVAKSTQDQLKAEPEYKLPEPCDHDGRRASISEQNVLDIVEMFQRGYGHKEIARHMKCSVSAVIGIMSGQNRSRVTGIYRPSGYKYKNSDGDFRLPQPCKGYDGRGVVITDQNAIAIVEMLDRGYTESEVSKHMGCTLSTIKDIKSGRSRGRVTGVVRPQPYYPSHQEPVIDDYVPTFGEGQQRVEEWLAYVKVDPANACLALPRLFLDKLPPSERKNMFVIGALDRLAECITRLDQLDHEIEIIPDEETEQSSEPETADADKEKSVTESAKNEPPYKPFSPSDIVPAPEGAVYLTPGQLAHRWGLGLATLSNWRSNGKGPLFMRPNNKGKGRVLYHIDEIKKVETEMTFNSTTQADHKVKSNRSRPPK